MRFVQRPDIAPEALSAPSFRRMREAYLEFLRLDHRRRAQTRPPDRHLPISPPLDDAVAQLFDHKCAFCETRVRLSTYRFRPTSEALPAEGAEGMLAYGWLADVWQNLYPICRDCQPINPNHFPVTGPRMPLPTPAEYGAYIEKGRDPTSAPRTAPSTTGRRSTSSRMLPNASLTPLHQPLAGTQTTGLSDWAGVWHKCK